MVVDLYDVLGDDAGCIEIIPALDDRKVKRLDELRHVTEDHAVVVIVEYRLGDARQLDYAPLGTGDVEAALQRLFGLVAITGDVHELARREVLACRNISIRIEGDLDVILNRIDAVDSHP